jgi:Fe-S-cluster containining protein
VSSLGLVEITHARVRLVEPDIFVRRFAADCMSHACRCRDEEDRPLLDACCQHGADLDLWERDAILARADLVAPLLLPEWRNPARWFDQSEPEEDPDFPSGTVIRTAVAGEHDAAGCVFLQHDRRGCALHRAAAQSGFPPEDIKPVVCRLYPMAFGDGLLGLSDDFDRYSCAGEPRGPTVYRLMREVLADVFDRELVLWLDATEGRFVGRRLPLVAHG